MPTTTRAREASFTGFPPETFRFFRDLGTHNTRDWFQPRKALFERVCLEPFQALTRALDPPFGATRISRIYRDVRFSKDKSPYHTHLSAIVRGNYLGLSEEGLYVGTGLYMPQSSTLRKLRAAIDAEASGRALADLVRTLRKKGCVVESHERVASTPRGYQENHPRIELLRMKDIHAGKTLAPAALATKNAVDAVRRVGAEVAPLGEWLRRHVGASSGQ